MRDLDQLRERRDDTNVRRLGLYTLAGLLAMLCGTIVLVTRSGHRTEPPTVDPLSELLAEQADDPKAPPRPKARPKHAAAEDLSALSFPRTLTGDEASIEATVRAAEAEHAALTGRTDAPGPERRPSRAADIPASTLAGVQSARLARVAQHDPLIAKAMPERSDGAMAPEGAAGPFTLQVVSYESREPAERFADALRRRGHRAYIAAAEVPGRSRYFRVRVGPFATRHDAVVYQRRFDQLERMHTIVVMSPAK